MALRARATFDDWQTFRIIGAAMEVHREIGCGFLEAVYRRALAVEFTQRRIPFEPEVHLPIRYKGGLLPVRYRADFVCFEDVIVEVKALRALGAIEQAQILNYLRASGYRRGLVLNFGRQSLEYRRTVLGWTPPRIGRGPSPDPCSGSD